MLSTIFLSAVAGFGFYFGSYAASRILFRLVHGGEWFKRWREFCGRKA